jgi:hypothetical protein
MGDDKAGLPTLARRLLRAIETHACGALLRVRCFWI